MEKRVKGSRRWWRLVCLTGGVIIVVALFLQAGILINVNSRNAYKTSQMLLDQAASIIEKNRQNEQALIQSMKEDYMVRAKAVAYIIDAKPPIEYNKEELQKIADLMSIDEIHLFNKNGVIYSGTVPEYYNYSFDSGEQMSYFKPMLDDKTLTMCQDVTPNTSEGKNMMYAITWNEAGERMIQVGIEPVRLLKELKQNEISAVVSNMPMYSGISVYVADYDTGEICGATDEEKVGKKIDDVGFRRKELDENGKLKATVKIDGQRYNCVFEKTGNYVVGVTYAASVNNESNLIAMAIVAVYLILAMIFILLMISRISRVNQEKKTLLHTSNTDELTGCFNRRAYEKDLREIPLYMEFLYISMDANGLKIVNDSMGHAAGDELLRGAAWCMQKCFSPYGKVYRVGGDEFAAVLFTGQENFEKIIEDFNNTVRGWSGQLLENISISCGHVSSREKTWSSMREIVETADVRMYEKKAIYYKTNGVDRLGQPAAYMALGRLYTKVLKINLTKDSYRILNSDEDKVPESGKTYSGRLSEWLRDFEDLELIHPDDREEYFERTDIEYLRNYFDSDQKVLSIFYRKKEGNDYKRIMLEIVPDDEYSEDNRRGYLYVKC